MTKEELKERIKNFPEAYQDYVSDIIELAYQIGSRDELQKQLDKIIKQS